VGDQFHFHPETYLEFVRSELPEYDRLQDEVARATTGLDVASVLELGTGTGVTSLRFLAEHPDARLVGIDESPDMLDHARRALPGADLRVALLQDPLPHGRFDAAISALAVHHLDSAEKADLFHRVRAALAPGGRFVLGDVVLPEDPTDVVAPIDGEHDKPSTVADQLQWLADAGFDARVTWVSRDLAVLVADLPDA
jgi:tRNA (cmo5U34)-methyltransferase